MDVKHYFRYGWESREPHVIHKKNVIVPAPCSTAPAGRAGWRTSPGPASSRRAWRRPEGPSSSAPCPSCLQPARSPWSRWAWSSRPSCPGWAPSWRRRSEPSWRPWRWWAARRRPCLQRPDNRERPAQETASGRGPCTCRLRGRSQRGEQCHLGKLQLWVFQRLRSRSFTRCAVCFHWLQSQHRRLKGQTGEVKAGARAQKFWPESH